MKNLVKVAGLAAILGVVACKNVDQGLVQELQQGTTTLEAVKPTADQTAQSIADLKNKVEAIAESDVKNGSKFMVDQIMGKYKTILEEYNATQAEIKRLTAEYQDGKLKTEEVSQRFATLKTELSNFETSLQGLQKITARPVEELAQLGNQIAQSKGLPAAPDANTTPSDAAGGGSDAAPSDADAAAGKTAAPNSGATLTGDGTQKRKQ